MSTLHALLDLLFPPKCPFCGKVLNKGEEGVCALCPTILPWTEESNSKTVNHCAVCLSPLWYRDSVPDAIERYKFDGGREHAKLFGMLIAQCLGDRWHGPVDVITWAPLSKERFQERGYDQAELLARRVGELAGIPVVPALEKIEQTETQSQLEDDEERRANVAGAYRALPGTDLSGKRLVLVDDIVTSGATLAECAARLREAGAASVVALTFARAR